MTTFASDASDPAFLSPEAQAAALWTFVQLKAPRFSTSDSLGVIRELGDLSQLDRTTLARRLKEALATRGMSMKHTNALQAAARLLGDASYHRPDKVKTTPPLLQLVASSRILNRPVFSWKEGIQCFCDYAEGDQEGGGLHTYQIGFTPTSVTMGTPMVRARDEYGRPIAELELQWSKDEPTQLAAAIAGVETLRRRYEETGRAVVDGIAAAFFNHHNPHHDAHPHDPLNSELVAIEVTPGPNAGEEIARGDEVRCWAELEKLHPSEKHPVYSIEGAEWLVDKSRYEWQLSTVRAGSGIPVIITRPLTTAESAKLFRRHRNAVAHQRYFVPEDRIKSMPALAKKDAMVELDMDQLSNFMSYDLAQAMAVQRRMSVDQFIKLAQVLKIADPSVLIRKPKRSELALLTNDEMLRAFISRIQDVVYEAPRRLSEEVVAEIDDAVNMLSTALKMDMIMADGSVQEGFPRNDPYLAYANQGKELLARLSKLGLVVYAGLFTTVSPFRVRGMRHDNIENPSTLTLDLVLFLDVDSA